MIYVLNTGEITLVIFPVFLTFRNFWSPGPEVDASRVIGDTLEQMT